MAQTEIRQNIHHQIDQLPDSALALVSEFLKFIKFKLPKVDESAQSFDVRGLWDEFDIDISEEDIATTRKEMWGSFSQDRI